MRLEVLRLLAFGPFTDLVIDLSGCASGLHVLYGDNAAGKSTTLRAVRGLLYGIPKVTPDAHRHRAADLRIGATLRAADGTTLQIVRRKGNVRTLLDAAGAPIDEAPLQRLLAGVGEEMFTTVFGLDHEALRRGADALLSDRGDVSESLFEAGSGVGGLHQLLQQLREEAEALWTPHAHKRPLNEALQRFSESRKVARADALSHEAWAAQEQRLAETRAEHARVEAERHALELRRRWLERARQVRPSLARRRQWRAERAALGAVPHLADDAAQARREAQQALAAAQAALGRLDQQLADLDQRLAALGPEPSALAPEGTAEVLADRAARLAATRDELARRQADPARLEDEVRTRAERLGAAADVPRLDLAAQARVRERAGEERALRERLAEVERRLADSSRRWGVHVARRAALGEPRDVRALERAIGRLREHGDLDARVAAARAEVERQGAILDAAVTGLSPFRGDAAAAARLAPPEAATLTRFEAELDELAERLRATAADRERARAQAAAAEQQLAALEGEGHVPAEQDLLESRARRARSWAEIRAAWAAGDRAQEPVRGPAYEQAVDEADELADRLRREAARVTRQASLRAARDGARRDEERFAAAEEALVVAREELRGRWRALWAPLALEPLPPAEMRAWCARHARVVELATGHAEAVRAAEELVGRARAVMQDVAEAFAAVEPAGAAARTPGPGLVDAAVARVEAEREREAAAAAHDEAVAVARADHDALLAEKATHEAARDAWQRDWAAVTATLGLAPDASAATALEVLEALRELWARRDEARAAARGVEDASRAAASLEQELGAAVDGLAPDLGGLPILDAVRRLVERLKVAAQQARDRHALVQVRAERREEQATMRATAQQAEARLESLRVAAGADDLADLERVEERWSVAMDLERRLADNAAQLLEAGEGASVDELEAMFGGLDADQLGTELAGIDERLPELGERARDLALEALRVDAGRERIVEELKVVHAAEDAQAHLARVRELAARFVRLRLASVVLSREIEAYRERNQGPVLSRASELFRRLTAPEFVALRAGWSAAHQDRLECVRANGDVLEVHELSDGQRDALYLALRLASVERALETCEPVPLVLDDVLIHMDDQNVRAALEVLADVSRRTQVLFFTHNEHIVAIARAALGEGRVCVHRLVRSERGQPEGARVVDRSGS